jgi:putative ABC transport system permease protein
MQKFFQDLRYGARMLIQNPTFTVIAVLTLGLGIGINTAIFSVVYAVLVRPLPFSEPDRLVWVWGNIRNGGNRASVSPLDYVDYREQNSSFEHFAATFSVPTYANLTESGEPERLQVRWVTGNFFQAMGVNAALGRTFMLENEKTGNNQVVVLSYGLWQQRFGGDASLIGKSVTLDGRKFEVVGVMPPEFKFPEGATLWLPMSFDVLPEMRQRRAHFLRPVGRLKAGVSLQQAQTDMDQVAGQLEAQYPESNTGWNLRMVPLDEQLSGNIRPTLQLLLGAVGFVLLIACANVANLLLVKAAGRQKEIALRLALGAGRWRIVQQMLTESTLLALLGGTLGIIFASWGVGLIVAYSGNNLPSTAQIGIDRTVLAFTLGLSILTGFLFGLVPALQATQPELNQVLKEGGKSAGRGAARNRTRNLLVIVETAIAVVLLIGAGLLVRSFIRLQQIDPGFDSNNVLTMRIDLPQNNGQEKYDTSERRALFWEQLETRLKALPGVEAVGMNTELPLSGEPNDTPFTVQGRPPVQPGQQFGADFRRVNQQYLTAMKIPLLRGRGFTQQEVRQDAHVVLISEALAQGVFPDEDPLGKQLLLGLSEQTPFEIIGIVGDIRHRTLDTPPAATMYLPELGTNWTNLTIRVAKDPLNLAGAVRNELHGIDSDLPVAGIRTMEQVVNQAVAAPRFRTGLLSLFAVVALFLASLGIYGVISHNVAMRTQEIGIRMALGANAASVLRLFIGQGLRLTLLGIGVGIIAAYGLSGLIQSLLFGVNTRDSLTFVGISMTLLAVALLACWIPAWRATKVDPMVALRNE